ncbi:interferon alpha-inducible protein 27-like protein 2A [Lytechinus variegatus]|uniref:interferon alpha-inducible protein 27-like protein 2A n=1 Tax=Lytechinus variegatus TaxID=7654 RepID=UPI001BB19FF6|nr:interferon alpha-inducible protein 27-like protein 2A [Lytechinus variegatus]XP_041452632.1 interferon alpha-inducible protein 27-like protein 2A [Lytechinus variegatus]XP_041452633.1 interferon alpha-inducible protein 27-like protein 2A [Lytechinus variegatus]
MESIVKSNFLTITCLILLTGPVQGVEAGWINSILTITGGTIVGVGSAMFALPAALGLGGFTASGISAGSSAAGMMSSAAIASGGGVASGSIVAVCQSIGAAGVSSVTTAVAGAVGGVAAAIVRAFRP